MSNGLAEGCGAFFAASLSSQWLGKPFIKNAFPFLRDRKPGCGIILLSITHLVFLLAHIAQVHQMVEKEWQSYDPKIIPFRNLHSI